MELALNIYYTKKKTKANESFENWMVKYLWQRVKISLFTYCGAGCAKMRNQIYIFTPTRMLPTIQFQHGPPRVHLFDFYDHFIFCCSKLASPDTQHHSFGNADTSLSELRSPHTFSIRKLLSISFQFGAKEYCCVATASANSWEEQLLFLLTIAVRWRCILIRIGTVILIGWFYGHLGGPGRFLLFGNIVLQ